MQGKVALEEHFATQETLMDSAGYLPSHTWPELKSRLLDIQDRRLRLMDQHGIEVMILSLNAPAVQAIPDPPHANEVARRANDFLAEEIAKRPQRFQAFAALAMQDPELASRELGRCVKELNFRGALVNGFSQIGDENTIAYYDLPQYWPFWATVEALGVPFYLHPRNPLPIHAKIYDVNAILELGSERILFSTDWPFENVDHAADWFDSASISENDRLKIGRTNAAQLFGLFEWDRNRTSSQPLAAE